MNGSGWFYIITIILLKNLLQQIVSQKIYHNTMYPDKMYYKSVYGQQNVLNTVKYSIGFKIVSPKKSESG